eukprot:CAMPEP_0198199392 /NCGR_PEP_ID=MMETSP1445-20131203/2703_1 /TAXON_ID=36898 /ORGANISM="Pyramimonas sp., Strain CCMP2087" /LENGTH=224 /DNA_ID=CAMNT_0043869231 /DNA_START=109 /DNA_END=779 /DNA_ORIENTATION=+
MATWGLASRVGPISIGRLAARNDEFASGSLKLNAKHSNSVLSVSMGEPRQRFRKHSLSVRSEASPAPQQKTSASEKLAEAEKQLLSLFKVTSAQGTPPDAEEVADLRERISQLQTETEAEILNMTQVKTEPTVETPQTGGSAKKGGAVKTKAIASAMEERKAELARLLEERASLMMQVNAVKKSPQDLESNAAKDNNASTKDVAQAAQEAASLKQVPEGTMKAP